MNLDYMMTDEYGNMVPTDNPNKGIPTRTRVRFRVSLHDNEQNTDNYFLSKVLLPNNPQSKDEVDFNFGTNTKETSYRDMYWNNVYTVKSFIPRFQHSQTVGNERFTGIKHTNFYGNNNPIPYNNIRIRLPFMFILLCALVNVYIWVVSFLNNIVAKLAEWAGAVAHALIQRSGLLYKAGTKIRSKLQEWTLIVLKGDLCPDLEGWYFAPTQAQTKWTANGGKIGKVTGYDLFEQTFDDIKATQIPGGDSEEGDDPEATTGLVLNDKKSIDYSNGDFDENDVQICLTKDISYLLSCVEMNLAQEYRIINFDFYNDWLNGVIYLPRWNKRVKKKKVYKWGSVKVMNKIKGCITSSGTGNGSKSFGRYQKYTQQCALTYQIPTASNPEAKITTSYGCFDATGVANENHKQKCHKKGGMASYKIFGPQGGVIQEQQTSLGQYVYYAKPCEWRTTMISPIGPYTPDNVEYQKVNLFATDIVLLGSLNECSSDGLPQAYKYLTSTSYKMPTNLAMTNLDDDSYLYGVGNDDDIRRCSGQQHGDNLEVKPIEGSAMTFGHTVDYYASTDMAISYAPLDEYVALTEGAGIAWNFTGPGQGKEEFHRDEKKLYQPGGHFLGISCFNSQTNIKSCVNLSRACEAGVSLSERREVVKSATIDPERGLLVNYKYYVPTGLISKDEIVDEDFRTMFATMNHKRLLAEKIDPKTGYPVYDFKYMHPTSFNGELRDVVDNGGSQDWYNGHKVSAYTTVESDVDIPGIEFEADIKQNTLTRTIETPSKDYYFFRLGIDSYDKAYSKYLLRRISGRVSLPVFENSYYFYFGLRPGATALDEFNKLYFASCGEIDYVDDSGYAYVEIAAGDIPSGETPVGYSSVPTNPTADYPKYIIVGGTRYKLINEDEPLDTVELAASTEEMEFSGRAALIGETQTVTITLKSENGVSASLLNYIKKDDLIPNNGGITVASISNTAVTYTIKSLNNTTSRERIGYIVFYLNSAKYACEPITLKITHKKLTSG
jgi:hypothetical protein